MRPRWGGSALCQPSHRSNEEGGSPQLEIGGPGLGLDRRVGFFTKPVRRRCLVAGYPDRRLAGGPEPRRLEHRIASERADHADRSWRIDWNREALPLDDATDPPSGRKRSSAKTLKSRAAVLRILLLWMAAEGIMRFAEIDRRAVGRVTAWLRDRPGHRSGTGVLTPLTMVNYMIVLKDLYRQRAKLDDAPLVDPLPSETTYEAAGVTRENKGAIPFIPDAVAIDLLSKALTWVEVHGDTIIAVETLRRDTRATSIAAGRGRGASDDVRQALREAGFP